MRYDFLDENRIYVGNIYMVVSIGNNGYKVELAKEDAFLYKINNCNYIDLYNINTKKDFEFYKQYYKKTVNNNNLFMKSSTNDPYVGELLVCNLKLYKNIKKLIKK